MDPITDFDPPVMGHLRVQVIKPGDNPTEVQDWIKGSDHYHYIAFSLEVILSIL
jgi:hypothetical protein